jgi:hypothetical protein
MSASLSQVRFFPNLDITSQGWVDRAQPISVLRVLPTMVWSCDVSPVSHPEMSRVCCSFDPIGLGGATGWGAKPASERSVPDAKD